MAYGLMACELCSGPRASGIYWCVFLLDWGSSLRWAAVCLHFCCIGGLVAQQVLTASNNRIAGACVRVLCRDDLMSHVGIW